MSMNGEYNNHHYVPQWHQKKFMLSGESNYFYLDMKPDSFTDTRGVIHYRQSVRKQGAKKCFVEKDLYTTRIKGIQTKDIEKYFFGEIDRKGKSAVQYFENYSYPLRAWGTSLNDLLDYMSLQKLRTPKGLAWLGSEIKSTYKDNILRSMVRFSRLHCALWMECVWLIADASKSDTKFIISDHPVTVYNRECGPRSSFCKNVNDPAIWLHGTHTIFPLSLEKILILTNLSWVRNPYQSAVDVRPNPSPFRGAFFNFTEVQIKRYLSEEEVRQINFIIKNRADRYIAAGKEEWLFPERFISKSDWNTYGSGYLLMPDPRSVHLGGQVFFGYKDGSGDAYDEYGRKPWDPDYKKEDKSGIEHKSLYWFQGEFAKLVGPYRRGRCMMGVNIEKEMDDDEFHKIHLSYQKKKFRERMNHQ